MILFCIEYKNIFTECRGKNVVLKIQLSIFNIRIVIFRNAFSELIKKMADNSRIKQTLRTVGQKFVVFLLKMFSFLPFWLLYLISDILYFVVTYVVRYRRNVIDENLFYSFPEKTESERALLRKKFYHHFCDMTLESLKMYSISESELDKRITFKLEGMSPFLTGKSGIIVLAMHYNNWEWGSFFQKKVDTRILGVFNRMRDNIPFDEFLLKARSQWGGEGVVMSNAARTAITYKNNNEPVLLWLAADQSAPPNSQYWTIFMNREAPFFAGPVKLAKKLNQPVLFQKNRKISRGRYEVEFIPLFKDPSQVSSEVILKTYVEKMEEVIREAPEYYLWSHRRWKHKRPQNVSLID